MYSGMILNCRSFLLRCAAVASVALSLVLVFPPSAGAQTSKTRASLEGTVTDVSGALIPQAMITLRNTSTNQFRALTTDDRGFFRANELPVGTYEVRLKHPGFAPYQHNGVILSLGQSVHLDVVLSPSSVSEKVTVSAQPSAIDTSQTSIVSSVDQERIEELPVRSRDCLLTSSRVPGQTRFTATRSFLPRTAPLMPGIRLRRNRASHPSDAIGQASP
jgi:hypothetical protein